MNGTQPIGPDQCSAGRQSFRHALTSLPAGPVGSGPKPGTPATSECRPRLPWTPVRPRCVSVRTIRRQRYCAAFAHRAISGLYPAPRPGQDADLSLRTVPAILRGPQNAATTTSLWSHSARHAVISQLERMTRTESALGPGGPWSPRGPGGPAGPAGPAAPTSPFSPAGPVAPAAPAGPAGPVSPFGPAGPSPQLVKENESRIANARPFKGIMRSSCRPIAS